MRPEFPLLLSSIIYCRFNISTSVSPDMAAVVTNSYCRGIVTTYFAAIVLQAIVAADNGQPIYFRIISSTVLSLLNLLFFVLETLQIPVFFVCNIQLRTARPRSKTLNRSDLHNYHRWNSNPGTPSDSFKHSPQRPLSTSPLHILQSSKMSSSETQSVSDSSKSEMPTKDLKGPEMSSAESQTLDDIPKVKTPTDDLDEAAKAERQAPLANANAKRKAEETEEIDAPPPPPLKKQKTKAATKARAKTSNLTQAKSVEPKKKRINKALREKIQQVLDFLASTTGSRSSLKRSKENKNHVTVKESALLGALMSLRADYEVSDPRMASVLDVKDVTVCEFVARIGTDQVLVKFLGMFLSA